MPIKYVVKNILERKWRAILIVFVIMSSVSLFFTSNGIINAIMNIYEEHAFAQYGKSDLVIQSTEDSGLLNINEPDKSNIKEEMKYFVGCIYMEGNLELSGASNNTGAIIGINDEGLQDINPVKVIEGSKYYKGNEVLIDKAAADRNNIKLNDTIMCSLNGQKIGLKVKGIVGNTGFSSDSKNMTIFIDLLTLYELQSEQNGYVSCIYVKCNEGEKSSEILKELKQVYPESKIINTSGDSFKNSLTGIRIGFRVLFVVAALVSIYILYITIRILTIERMSVLATYKSLGASKKWIVKMQLQESFIYGILGGVLGLVMGIILLRNVVFAMVSKEMFEFYNYQLSVKDVISVLLVSIVISILSSILPVIESGKISLVQLITGLKMKQRKSKKTRFILGGILLASGIVIPFFYIREISLLLNIISLLFIFFSIVMLVPLYTKIVRHFIDKIGGLIKNTTYFALKNVTDNYHLISNITLITLSVSIIVMISNAGNGMLNSMSYAYIDSCSYDLQLIVEQLDSGFTKQLDDMEEVSDYYISNKVTNVSVNNFDSSIAEIEGVNFPLINKYRQYDFNEEYDVENWDKDWIILSNALKQQFDIEKGDKLVLEINNIEYTFTVRGFVDTLINSGDYALVDYSKLSECTNGLRNQNVGIYLNGNIEDITELKNILKQQFGEYNVEISSLEDLQADIKSQSSSMFIGISCFTLIVIIIICIGIIGNQLLCSLYRKKEFALLQVLGMSDKQKKRVVQKEGIICILLGIVIGIIYGFIMLFVVSRILYAAYQPINIVPDILLTLYITIGVAIIYIIVSCMTKKGSNKDKIKECLAPE